MQRQRLVNGLAGAFGVMTVILGVGTLAGSLILLPVTGLFALATYLLWGHASGRFLNRMYEGVEDRGRGRGRRAASDGGRGRTGAGPREEWTPPRDGRSAAEQARRRAGDPGGRRRRGGATRGRQADDGPTAREAYDRLGLEPGADEAAVREAYRERIKEVHPDAGDGDAEAFKRVQAAYDRLTEAQSR